MLPPACDSLFCFSPRSTSFVTMDAVVVWWTQVCLCVSAYLSVCMFLCLYAVGMLVLILKFWL